MGSERRAITAPGAPEAIGAYSHAVAAAGLLFCSGQVPLDPESGELIDGDAAAQAQRCLENLEAVCEAAGARLANATLVSLYLTTQADRIGRRRTLIAGAGLMVAAGLAFAFTREMWLLVLAGTIGVISPSGGEVGPFLPIEQAALSQVVPDRARTDVFAWYTLAGALATALGALAAGFLTDGLQRSWTPVDSYRAVVLGYALLGAGAEFRLADPLTVFVRIDNLTDKTYESILGVPGLPRALRVGGRFSLGGR